jgi:hypothetical protein
MHITHNIFHSGGKLMLPTWSPKPQKGKNESGYYDSSGDANRDSGYRARRQA